MELKGLTGSDMNKLTVATMQVDALRKQVTDAQATIAALQARVRELEQWVQDQSTANLEKMRHTDEMQSRAMEAESQLTQRTAELEAVKADTKNMLDVATRRLHEQVNDLQAELERVRGELQSAEAGYFVAERELQGANNKYDELRTLIAALPKVEGEIMVSESLVLAEDPDMCSDMSDKEDRKSVV